MINIENLYEEDIFEIQVKKAKRAAKRRHQIYEGEEYYHKKDYLFQNDDVDEMYATYLRYGCAEEELQHEA